ILYVYFFFSSRRRHTRSKRDWSSDVCSSDLICGGELRGDSRGFAGSGIVWTCARSVHGSGAIAAGADPRSAGRNAVSGRSGRAEIGRASCRERVEIAEGGGAIKKKKV